MLLHIRAYVKCIRQSLLHFTIILLYVYIKSVFYGSVCEQKKLNIKQNVQKAVYDYCVAGDCRDNVGHFYNYRVTQKSKPLSRIIIKSH